MYKLLSNLKIDLDSQQTELFDKYINLFKNYNRFVNLISRKETDYVFEKHIYDSLAVNLFFNKYQTGNKIIDVGTGGGFPSLPMAICYKDKNITAIDSVGKKINFINTIFKYLCTIIMLLIIVILIILIKIVPTV